MYKENRNITDIIVSYVDKSLHFTSFGKVVAIPYGHGAVSALLDYWDASGPHAGDLVSLNSIRVSKSIPMRSMSIL